MIVAYAAYNALVRGTIENLGTPGQQRVVVACHTPLVAWDRCSERSRLLLPASPRRRA